MLSVEGQSTRLAGNVHLYATASMTHVAMHIRPKHQKKHHSHITCILLRTASRMHNRPTKLTILLIYLVECNPQLQSPQPEPIPPNFYPSKICQKRDCQNHCHIHSAKNPPENIRIKAFAKM